jgi:uncharacterized protein YydD (DUF2326 family)
LDFEHSTKVGMTNAIERALLREMDQLRKRKKELEGFVVLDDAVRAARAARDAIREQLDAATAQQVTTQSLLERGPSTYGCEAWIDIFVLPCRAISSDLP